MRLYFTLVFSTFLVGGTLAQRDNPPTKKGTEQSGFKYEEIGDFSEDGHFVADIIPIRSMIYGTYHNIGAGAGLSFYNLGGKVSLETDFAFNYFNYPWAEGSLYHGIENYDKKSSMEFGGVISYSLSAKKEKKETYTYLQSPGNVIHYSMLPATHSRSVLLQAGFKSIGMFNQSDVTFSDYYYDPYEDTATLIKGPKAVQNFFQSRSVYLGVKFLKTTDTRYNTDKYGEVSAHNMSEIYGGLLIGMKTEIPDVYQYQHNSSYYPNDITDVVPIPVAGQRELEEDYNFLPVGFRVGIMNSDKRSGFAFSWELAMYPGYNKSVLQQLSIRLGIHYRILKNFK